MQLGFAKGHHKITPREKVGVALGRGAPQKLGFPFNIFTMTEDSDFKFGLQLGFAKGYHKITPREKLGVAMGYGLSLIHI